MLRQFQSKDGSVAKLFAKHIKLQESIDFCKRKRFVMTKDVNRPPLTIVRITVGVGTPQRIMDLLDDGTVLW